MTEFLQFIEAIEAGRSLTRDESRAAFELIMTGSVEPDQMGQFLKSLAGKGETVDEITGAADVMNEKVTRVRCDADCIDTCGTGGDGISTFNVSTTAAIIAAAAGATVAKHGNRTNTRVSGSAEAIKALGVNLDASIPVLEESLRLYRMAFLYAPNLHPAMKYAGPVRKQLGIRTIFNLLGPLTNPAGAKRQVLGVSKPELTETLAQVLAARGAVHAWVVHGHDGLCDLTITGPTKVTEVANGEIRTFHVTPKDAGLAESTLDRLLVDSPEASADAVRDIVTRESYSPQRDHALMNAGAALVVAGLADNLSDGVRQAAVAIEDGRAENTLRQLITISHRQ